METPPRVRVVLWLEGEASIRPTDGELRGGASSRLLGEEIATLIARYDCQPIWREDGGLLMVFYDLQAALRCGLALCTEGTAEGTARAIRIGGNLGRGDASVETLSPVASRLAVLARNKQFLVSKSLFDASRLEGITAPALDRPVLWVAHGTYQLHGLPEPLELFEIGLEGASPLTAPDESREAKRVEGDAVLPGWRPACGLCIPRTPKWKLRRRIEHHRSEETWLASHVENYRKHFFKFILDLHTIEVVKWRRFWLHQLKKALKNCKRIVRVYNFDFDATPPFIETAVESGDLLRDVPELARSRLPFRLDLLAQIADTLAVAHNGGVIHGNLCPGNILIEFDSEGNPKVRLRNFAIPPSVDSPERELYQMPSCGEGKNFACTGTDAYSLGVLFYQMISEDLTKPLPDEWEKVITDDYLKEGISSAVSLFQRGRYKSLRSIADGLRAFGGRPDQTEN